MARSLSGGPGGTILSIVCSDLVAIAIAAMNRRTVAITDALYPALFGQYIKGATGPNQHSSHVDALFRAARDNCPYHISCLEALDLFSSFGFRARKANLVDIAFLPAAMPARRNQQRVNASDLERVRRAPPQGNNRAP